MARPLRLEYPGGVYHVTARGNARQAIFLSDSDRQAFLGLLATVVRRFHWLCHAYCLMDNHYHLLLETLEGNLSRGMRQLNGVYTQWFNRTHGRVGHLFQGRYKAIVVEKGHHLLELCRYVVLNPVRAGSVAQPGAWRWSSYRATAGEESVPAFLTVEWVLGQFAADWDEAVRRYKTFVDEGRGQASPWGALRGQVFFGGDTFVEGLQARVKPGVTLREIPRTQRYAARPPLAALFASASGTKAQLMYTAHVEYGYTLREIAAHLGVHYTTVSKLVRKVEQERQEEGGRGVPPGG